MVEGSSGKAREISLGDDFGEVIVRVNGMNVQVHADGVVESYPNAAITKPGPANDIAAKAAHEVGEHLKDGTVVIAVDLEHNKALFAPEGIFGGDAKFDYQDKVVQEANRNKLHGHGDWRRTTDGENKKLSEVWNKVAPPALQGSAAPWFWGASAYYGFYGGGRVWRGGEADWNDGYRNDSRPVPVVFSGPARS